MEHPKKIIPADVPQHKVEEFIQNYDAITHKTERLFLFACDQKIEHLHQDFYGAFIHPDAQYPEHLFKIAHRGTIGAMATHLGLIARYAKEFPDINYIVKLTGKTNIIKTEQKDPDSSLLYTVKQAVEFKQESQQHIRGIGLTIYLGSKDEDTMLSQAAQSIYEAHQEGLITILWVYPRGKAVPEESDPQLIAGATGVANSLGADFVKIKMPEASESLSPEQNLKLAVAAAGDTKVIVAGGKSQDPKNFLHDLYQQLHIGGSSGCATGRNVFQQSLAQAVVMTKAISALVYERVDLADAIAIFEQV